MKPTQKDLIELAREAGIREQMPSEDDLPAVWLASTPEIIRFVHLALERFGAGGVQAGDAELDVQNVVDLDGPLRVVR